MTFISSHIKAAPIRVTEAVRKLPGYCTMLHHGQGPFHSDVARG